jgi:lipopolysaccharide heptosyltransferase I
MTDATLPQIVETSQRATSSPRVLIIRLSAVGDCIQTMPLACAIRELYPDAHVTWVVEKGSASLVEACDAVDRVIVLPKRFAKSPKLLAWLWRGLRRERFDLAFDPQGLTKSGLVAWLSGSRRRIGFSRPVARELNPWLQTDLVTSRAEHRIPRYLELLEPLGIVAPRIRFGISLPTAAEKAAAEFAEQAELRGDYFALNPGAGWDSKRWPPERYAVLARRLASRGIRSVVTWGGNQERLWAESIVAESRGAALLAPPTSLLELAALFRKAKLYVGSDTGPLHLAAAVGTSCVALFGASSAAGCGPYGSGHICLQAAFDQSPGRKRTGADNWAMRLIAVDSVFQACDQFLSAKAVGRSAA